MDFQNQHLHMMQLHNDYYFQVHSDDATTAINYLKKAHEMAREGLFCVCVCLSCLFCECVCVCVCVCEF